MEKPEQALVDSLRSGALGEIVEDRIENILDSQISDEILKEIPVIKQIKAVVSAGLSMRDYFFTKKILRFLMELNKIPKEKRTEMVETLEKDSEYCGKVGERVLHLIDRLNDVSKSQLVGRAFATFAAGEIGRETLDRLCLAIERLEINDLKHIPGTCKSFCVNG